MATALILGPTVKEPQKGAAPDPDLFETRRQIARILGRGHRVLIMEDEAAEPGETSEEKFLRLVESRHVTDVLLYWPPGAEMGATVDELLLLLTHRQRLPPTTVWLLHHSSALEIRHGELIILEPGSKSGYLKDATRLPLRPLPWSSLEELLLLVKDLADNVLVATGS